MKAREHLWISVSVLLCTSGGYLVFESVGNSSALAEGGVLLGGTLIGCALFALSQAAQQHLQLRALERHMKRANGAKAE